MKKGTASFLLGTAVVVVLTLAFTWFAGTLTGRFGTFRGMDDARTSLKALPMEIGKWRAEEEQKMSDNAEKMLRVQDSYIIRTYKHADTQEDVHLTLMVGPSGRITVHTPEICFGGRDYEKEAARARVPISVQTQSEDGEISEIQNEFWRVDFVGRSLDFNNRISFYWAASSGDAWQASDRPRYDYRKLRYVYKLQAQAYSGAGDDNAGDDNDTVKRFLEECLPTIHEHLSQCY
ncbi:MAG: EpsI family protein [Planctomycetaceae bacterium]|nr:EpsI family protein [Planctomycetaceae bacterium]